MFTRAMAFVLPLLVIQPAFAIHYYASYDCKAKSGLRLAYDGPGSNYAVGGYSNFYVKGSQTGLIAYEPSEENDTSKIGDEIGDSKLQVIFESDMKAITKEKHDINPGAKCTPEETDYRHGEFKSVRNVKITAISKNAAAKLGLKKGETIKMVCNESEDMPITCPASGRYAKGDLE